MRSGIKRNEMKLSERRKMATKLIAFLEGQHAVKGREYTYEDRSKTSYEYTMETPLGKLEVHFTTVDVHLHCRFHENDRAILALNPTKSLNGIIGPYTAKYNVYVFDNCTANVAMSDIMLPHLAHIWVKMGQPVPWEAAVAAV